MSKKFVNREPRAFLAYFSELPDDEAVVLHAAGLQGLQAESTTNTQKPKEAQHEFRVTKEGLLIVLKILAALRQKRAVKLSPDKKSWNVYIGPKP